MTNRAVTKQKVPEKSPNWWFCRHGSPYTAQDTLGVLLAPAVRKSRGGEEVPKNARRLAKGERYVRV